jgi:hypothetical protein
MENISNSNINIEQQGVWNTLKQTEEALEKHFWDTIENQFKNISIGDMDTEVFSALVGERNKAFNSLVRSTGLGHGNIKLEKILEQVHTEMITGDGFPYTKMHYLLSELNKGGFPPSIKEKYKKNGLSQEQIDLVIKYALSKANRVKE